MSSLSYYAQNKTLDALFRGQALGAPATMYFALFIATRGKSNNVRSAVVAPGDTLIPATPNGHMYRCTVGGTCGAGEPAWNTGSGSTTADGGTVIWKEMTPDFLANTNLTEVSAVGTGYARVGVAASLTEFSGTQGPGSTAPSSGTSGLISNNNTETFPAPIGDWGVVAYQCTFDAPTGGNLITQQALTAPKTVNSGDSAPTIAPAAFSEQIV